MRDGGRTYLIASSQGDSTYPVWQVEGSVYVYKGRFAVEGGAIDNVTVTDGIDAWSGPIGPYPEGAIAMHDTDDGDGRQQAPFPGSAQAPHRGERLHHPGDGVPQADAVEAFRQQAAQRLERQRQQGNAIGEGDVQAVRRQQVGHLQRRPAPGVGEEVALRDGMLGGIALRCPGAASAGQQEFHREDGHHQRHAEQQREAIGEEGLKSGGQWRHSRAGQMAANLRPRPFSALSRQGGKRPSGTNIW